MGCGSHSSGFISTPISDTRSAMSQNVCVLPRASFPSLIPLEIHRCNSVTLRAGLLDWQISSGLFHMSRDVAHSNQFNFRRTHGKNRSRFSVSTPHPTSHPPWRHPIRPMFPWHNPKRHFSSALLAFEFPTTRNYLRLSVRTTRSRLKSPSSRIQDVFEDRHFYNLAVLLRIYLQFFTFLPTFFHNL